MIECIHVERGSSMGLSLEICDFKLNKQEIMGCKFYYINSNSNYAKGSDKESILEVKFIITRMRDVNIEALEWVRKWSITEYIGSTHYSNVKVTETYQGEDVRSITFPDAYIKKYKEKIDPATGHGILTLMLAQKPDRLEYVVIEPFNETLSTNGSLYLSSDIALHKNNELSESIEQKNDESENDEQKDDELENNEFKRDKCKFDSCIRPCNQSSSGKYRQGNSPDDEPTIDKNEGSVIPNRKNDGIRRGTDWLRRRTPDKEVYLKVREPFNAELKKTHPEKILDNGAITNDCLLRGYEPKSGAKVYETDHIISMKTICSLEDFEKLSCDNQLKLLNYEDNFVMIGKSGNASMGAKSYRTWEGHKGKNIAACNFFRKQMIDKENSLIEYFRKEIDHLKTDSTCDKFETKECKGCFRQTSK